ncbi:helix-turn-helix transcriptional regulator [Kitasatospora sp. NPDC059722]|uniref:helix-turn-helix transcriptional regulator n=1 Tax=Kitasatospora sp. NPDC059722 TaxID=3346925 RepID=UPI0036BD87EC
MAQSRTFLADRDNEFRELLDALSEVRSGRAAVTVVDGPSGLGKTALLDALGREARDQEMTVLRARCSIVERDFHFGAVRQLLAPVLGAPAARRPAAAQKAEAVLEGMPYRMPEPGSAAADFDRLASLCAPVLQLAEERPVVLAVDDVCWADEYSSQWLAFLARRLDDVPVQLAVVSRGSLPNAGGELVHELMQHPACRVVQPGLLTVEGAARVVAEGVGPGAAEAFGPEFHAMTGGNPALVAALVRELGRTGGLPETTGLVRPGAVGERVLPTALRALLRREPPVVLRVAGLLAELGVDTGTDVLRTVTGLEQPLLDHAVTALEGSGLLAAGPAGRFCHPQVSESLAGLLAATDRAIAHADTARALFRARAAAERIAAHVVAGASTGEPWRVEVLRRAARSAGERGDTAAAVRFLRHALTETASTEVRHRLLVELGTAEAHSDLNDCVRHLGEAETLSTDPEQRAEFVPLLARALVQSGLPRPAIDLLDRTAAELSDTNRLLLPILSLRAVIPDGGRPACWGSLTTRGPRAEPTGRTPDERGLLAALAMRSVIALDGADRAGELAGNALRGFHPAQDQAQTAVLAVTALLDADRIETARRGASEIRAADLAHWPPAARAVTAAVRARLRHRTGELAAALDEAEHALALSDEPHPYLPHVVAAAVQVLLETDRVEAAAELVERVAGAAGHAGWTWPYFLEARARVRMAQGQAAAALRDLMECGRLMEELWGDNPGRIAWRSRAAVIEHRLNRPEAAQEFAAQEVEQAQAWGAPVVLARALRVAALVGPRALARTGLEDSVALLENASDPLELARSVTALGTLLAATGHTDAGRARLRQALALTQAAGATALAGRVHNELLATGARPRRLPQVGPESLTPSQQRIARLAAEGLSNEDIAARLYITRRTVEFHLTHVYRKLCIDGRVGLRAALFGEAA